MVNLVGGFFKNCELLYYKVVCINVFIFIYRFFSIAKPIHLSQNFGAGNRGIHEMFKKEHNWSKEFMDENDFHFDSDNICLVITIEAGISALCSLLSIIGICCRSRGFMIPYLGKSKQTADNFFLLFH